MSVKASDVRGSKTGTWNKRIGMFEVLVECVVVNRYARIVACCLELQLRREIDCHSNLENVPKNL